MALTKEEIAIRVGVDSKGVSRGMLSVQGIVEDNMRGVTKKLRKFTGDILGGAVMGFVGQATQAAEKMIDSLSDYVSKEFFDAIYNSNKHAMDAADEAWQASKKKRGAQKESQTLEEEFAKKSFAAQFEQASFEDQTKILKDEIESISELSKKNESRMRELKGLKGAEEQYYKAKSVWLKDQIALLDAESKLRKHLEKQQKQEIETLAPHTDERLEPSRELIRPELKVISDYYRKIASDRESYGAKGEAAKYRAMADAMYKAQVDAAGEIVQKVSIVEVKE